MFLLPRFCQRLLTLVHVHYPAVAAVCAVASRSRYEQDDTPRGDASSEVRRSSGRVRQALFASGASEAYIGGLVLHALDQASVTVVSLVGPNRALAIKSTLELIKAKSRDEKPSLRV